MIKMAKANGSICDLIASALGTKYAHIECSVVKQQKRKPTENEFLNSVDTTHNNTAKDATKSVKALNKKISKGNNVNILEDFLGNKFKSDSEVYEYWGIEI